MSFAHLVGAMGLGAFLFALGFALGYYFREQKADYVRPVMQRRTPQPVVSSAPGQSCHFVTFTFSDGTEQALHECQGATKAQFTMAHGRTLAPQGAILVRRRGGVHRE